jgi:hypothetical protein
MQQWRSCEQVSDFSVTRTLLTAQIASPYLLIIGGYDTILFYRLKGFAIWKTKSVTLYRKLQQ